jgi:hypothetical protein
MCHRLDERGPAPACGGITWSSVATMYHDGRCFQAGGPDFATNTQRLLHRSHNASLYRIDVSRKDLGETVSVNPKKTVIVSRRH